MSKKVLFYLSLDLVGIGITIIVHLLLCKFVYWLALDHLFTTLLLLVVHIVAGAVYLFIIFFFLLYWWSDRKWTAIKRKYRRKR